jgi:mannose-6-phosphate isomerase
MATPYPLLFEPMLFEKVWGGRRLERLGKRLPPGKKIGESWELADLAATSTSGAGGGAARSTIINGPLAGRTIREAMDAAGENILPRAARAADGGFPLLIKFLDAGENLSVQVHPSPAYAAAHPEAHLKTECWYILDAEPGSVIYKGIRPGVSREEFERLARTGDPAIVDAMAAAPAVPGECHNLPSGTVHALGAGVLVAEVQTPSDTTFRLYDWGRTGRELHIEAALACADFGPPPPAVRLDAPGNGAQVTTEWFTVTHARIDHDGVPAATLAGRAMIVLAGSIEFTGAKPPGGPTLAPTGQTCFIPARVDPGVLVRAASDEPARVLLATILVPMSRLA